MLLIDTGIFVSAADRSEPRHGECADVLRGSSDLGVVASVIPEAAWLIEDRLGPAAERRFLTVVTSSRFTIVDLVVAAAGLTPSHPHFTPWPSARRRMPWMRRTVAGAKAAPPLPPEDWSRW